MNEPSDDLAPEEKELLKRPGASLSALREHHADCPRLEILLASQAGVLPEVRARSIAAHLAKCTFCQILLKDLGSEDFVTATAEEEQHVRERVLPPKTADKESGKAKWGFFSGLFWKAVSVGALAAAAIALAVWIRVHQAGAPPTSQVAQVKEVPKPAVTPVLQWEKLPIRLQAQSVLLWRGKPRTAQERYASELTAALAFYRDDNFAEAIKQLAEVVKDFPRGVEAQLYLGVSELQMQQNPEAITPLKSAQRLGPEQFREDATWYLAIAYQRTGETQASLAELQKLCGGKSSYAEKACQAMKANPSSK